MVTIIIPTRNRGQYLYNCLLSLLPQLHPKDEVIVINNASTDNTNSIMSSFTKYKQIRYLIENKIGPSYARNTGISASNNDIIAFLDDDCLVAHNWLSKIKKIIFSDGNSRSVYVGKIKFIFHSHGILENLFLLTHEYEWERIRKSASWKHYRTIDFLHAGNFFARKKILNYFQPLFDEKNFPFIGEERDLLCRLNISDIAVRYVPTIVVKHISSHITLYSMLRSSIATGFAQGKLCYRYQTNIYRQKLFRSINVTFLSRYTIYKFLYKKYKYNLFIFSITSIIILIKNIILLLCTKISFILSLKTYYKYLWLIFG